MSTKEEALKKVMEQKESLKGQGDSLQKMVEDAVRKALDGVPYSAESGLSPRSFAPRMESYSEQRISVESVLPKETEHSLWWIRGINPIAIGVKRKMREGEGGAVLFASSVSGEGTTTICSNVSLSLAKGCPGKVLLLDCNAQHPEVHKLFNIETVPGLIDILTEKIRWEDAVRKSNLTNYYVLPYGQPVQEPLSILGSERMTGLLNVLKINFDFLFLDAPPILVSAEAEMIMPWVEAAVLIIKAHASRREVVKQAVDRLLEHKTFLGAVLNQQTSRIPLFPHGG